MRALSHVSPPHPPPPFYSHSVSPSVPVWMKPLFLPYTRQVDNAKVLHYVGAGIAFPTSMLFVCLQSALTYRLAKTQGEYSVAHLRLCMTLLAFVALVLSILSSHKQMAAFGPVKCFTTRRGGALPALNVFIPLVFNVKSSVFVYDKVLSKIDRGDFFF